MSCVELYKITKSGDVNLFGEVKNSFLGAMSVWMFLEKKYLEPYRPSWASDDKTYSRLTDPTGEKLTEIWDIFKLKDIEINEKICLGSTFDNVIVYRKNLVQLVDAFYSFGANSNLKEQANLISNLLKNDDDFLGICWNQTSVNGDAWQTEDYVPYNIFKQDGHWDLFDYIN